MPEFFWDREAIDRSIARDLALKKAELQNQLEEEKIAEERSKREIREQVADLVKGFMRGPSVGPPAGGLPMVQEAMKKGEPLSFTNIAPGGEFGMRRPGGAVTPLPMQVPQPMVQPEAEKRVAAQRGLSQALIRQTLGLPQELPGERRAFEAGEKEKERVSREQIAREQMGTQREIARETSERAERAQAAQMERLERKELLDKQAALVSQFQRDKATAGLKRLEATNRLRNSTITMRMAPTPEFTALYESEMAAIDEEYFGSLRAINAALQPLAASLGMPTEFANVEEEVQRGLLESRLRRSGLTGYNVDQIIQMARKNGVSPEEVMQNLIALEQKLGKKRKK